jgi:hypothetical protein
LIEAARSATALVVEKFGSKAEIARELADRLNTVAERKRPAEALSYNALVQSWPEITRAPAPANRPRPPAVMPNRPVPSWSPSRDPTTWSDAFA